MSADPRRDPTATKYDAIDYMDVMNQDLKVMDATAIAFCRDNGIPIVVFSIREQGNLASNLQGAGTRWTAAQLRLRVADARRLDPDGLMPSLHRLPPAAASQRVGAAWRGMPVLDAQQVEDVVAFLQTLP